jgi:hypothetical protein
MTNNQMSKELKRIGWTMKSGYWIYPDMKGKYFTSQAYNLAIQMGKVAKTMRKACTGFVGEIKDRKLIDTIAKIMHNARIVEKKDLQLDLFDGHNWDALIGRKKRAKRKRSIIS